MPSNKRDMLLIGGGIVGTATARAYLARHPNTRLTIIEKEPDLAKHQTGHNSGVVHAGIYYKPGSLKARLCVAGAQRMREFALERGIPFKEVGKLIVAVDDAGLASLDSLWQRAQANGVPGAELVGPEQIKEHEPHAAGRAGIWSPKTAIIDYTAVTQAYADDIRNAGGEIVTGAKVVDIESDSSGFFVTTTQGEYEGKTLVNCAGLYSDRIALMMGVEPYVRIVPFRGEYYTLKPECTSLVNGLIYPVPDPQFPFLGVHFTRSVHGSVEAGPNAVLALAREGYGKFDISIEETSQTLRWRGFQMIAARYWRTGLSEMYRSANKAAFAGSLRKLVPELRTSHLAPGGSGVRAQAIDSRGKMVDDFHVLVLRRSIHVLNVPSPAATASLSVADSLVQQIETALN
ncbi:MAG: L-2-hydroxyglutarate oxidase [Capsulimonadaceae bacterium]|nr:L-2-hydroxyglutarate oxidase [Capsulimonadaceae bacterium]